MPNQREATYLTDPEVSKANALKTILHTYGISAEEVIAFGDNPNIRLLECHYSNVDIVSTL